MTDFIWFVEVKFNEDTENPVEEITTCGPFATKELAERIKSMFDSDDSVEFTEMYSNPLFKTYEEFIDDLK